jgi:hypothetical protein
MWYCCMGSRRGEGLASLISLMLFSGLLYIMALYSFPSFVVPLGVSYFVEETVDERC